MNAIAHMVVRLVRAAHKAWERKISFLVCAFVFFLGSVAVLARLDLLPEKAPITPALVLDAVRSEEPRTTALAPEEPARIIFPSLEKEVGVANPTSTEIAVLDAALLDGAVRYPLSAKLGENGNVVLFGHSSYLPIVRNQAFKAFTGIEKLKKGDAIIVHSSAMAYTYTVRSVSEENAESDGISLAVSGKVLTLATCNSFGEKSDRFVVVADFVESHPISG